MKERSEFFRYRALVRIGLHNICHEVPPLTVDRGICPLTPEFLILNLNIAKEGQGLRIKKNRVVLTPVLMNHVNHLWPKFPVTALILPLLPGEQFHLKSLDHLVHTLPLIDIARVKLEGRAQDNLGAAVRSLNNLIVAQVTLEGIPLISLNTSRHKSCGRVGSQGT